MEVANVAIGLYDRVGLYRLITHLSIACLMLQSLQSILVYGILALAVLYLMRKWGVFNKTKSDKDCDCGSGCH